VSRWSSWLKDLLKDVLVIAVVVIAVAGFGVVLTLPKFGGPSVRLPEAQSLTNARQIAIACIAYACDHEGNFPPSLDAVVPTYLKDRKHLASPLNPSDPIGYIYTPGLKYGQPDVAVLIEDKFAQSLKHDRVVVYTDGSARILRPSETPAPKASGNVRIGIAFSAVIRTSDGACAGPLQL